VKEKKYVCTHDGVEVDGKVYNKGDILYSDKKLNVTYFSEVRSKRRKRR